MPPELIAALPALLALASAVAVVVTLKVQGAAHTKALDDLRTEQRATALAVSGKLDTLIAADAQAAVALAQQGGKLEAQAARIATLEGELATQRERAHALANDLHAFAARLAAVEREDATPLPGRLPRSAR
jgi:chromosome segregation ATPase